MVGVGHRGRLRDQVVKMNQLLHDNREVTLAKVADELGVSERTARRLVDSFGDCLPLRMERGTVFMEED
jgi:predicted DNA-binding transcriptional regulator YafY